MFAVRSFAFIIFCLFFSEAYGQDEYELDTYGQEEAYAQDLNREEESISGRSLPSSEQEYAFTNDEYEDSISGRSLASNGKNYENEQSYQDEPISERSLLLEQDQSEQDYAYDQEYANEPNEDQVISGRSLLFDKQETDYSEVYDDENRMEIPIAERSLSASSTGSDCGKTPNTPSVLRHFKQLKNLILILLIGKGRRNKMLQDI